MPKNFNVYTKNDLYFELEYIILFLYMKECNEKSDV